MKRSIPIFILAAAIAVPGSAKNGPEWTQIKSAETDMKAGQFPQAESDLQQAMSINPDEPKIDEDLSLVHIVFDELSQAKKDVNQAIDISKRKQGKYKKGGPPFKAWQKYLAELYSINAEITILENEKVLRAGLMKSKAKKPKSADLDKALAKVRAAYEKVKIYGSFKSRVDDELISKAIGALSSHHAAKAAVEKAPAADDSGEEADEAGSDDEGGEEAAAPASGGGGKGDDGAGGGEDLGPASMKADAGAATKPVQISGNDAMSAAGGSPGGAPAAGPMAATGGSPAAAPMTATGGSPAAAPSSGAAAPSGGSAAGKKADEPDPFAAIAPAAPADAGGGKAPAAGAPAAKGGGDNPFGGAPTK